ncbi:Cas10/Cmr2 second palm domain-containing protein [Phaeodactylibacter xiamenensis]|uniref:Cas10/Cmr2 second palm domain-containing protein n=1 Tax=Phaeodactylibacter xiamenensis TaxID=1524460 RepID=UPI0024A7F268|nr:hypothetical protein [Phaeodactylibacter xiamenensis]
MTERFLFGFEINEIQDLIFETGKLKEIIGGSVFVEQACKDYFRETVGEENYKQENQVITAAGKVQYIFDDIGTCQFVVKNFFKRLSEEMPGINFNQAIIKIGENLRPSDIENLERRLETQRNISTHQHQLALMISERSRRTGSPAIEKRTIGSDIDFLDQKQQTKQDLSKKKLQLFEPYLENAQEAERLFPQEIDDIRKGEDNEWIAVVHADGNGLGKLIQDISAEAEQKVPDKYQSLTASFSKYLDQSTKKAARGAYQTVIEPLFKTKSSPRSIPLSPVLLGGDDLTMIIRADLALHFVHEFLELFEHHTKQAFDKLRTTYGLNSIPNGLTACAGIAYIKYNYPFHFGVNLANDLCKYAKNRTKALPGDHKQPLSCLAFQKVQSSEIGNFEKDIMERELKVSGDNEAALQFNNGPYFLSDVDSYPNLDEFRRQLILAQQDGAPISGLREWLSALYHNPAQAKQLMKRIERLNPHLVFGLGRDQPWTERTYQKIGSGEIIKEKVTHIYDLLALAKL